jgi:hypothetical protein
MVAGNFSFGVVVLDGKSYTEDIIIERGEISRRHKSVSRISKETYGHTPLTVHENIPWDCDTLIIGTGMNGGLPITDEIFKTAEELCVKIILKKTKDALEHLGDENANFILHLTC